MPEITGKTFQQIKLENDIGNIQDGDQLLGQRIAGIDGVITFNGVLYDADFNANGIAVRTASGAYANRVLTGVTNKTTITNGDGVLGNPTVDISATYIGQNTITTLGTIITGTWNGSNIPVANGGSGRATATAYALVAGGTTSTGIHQSLITGTAGDTLISGGAGALPTWTTSPTFTAPALGTPISGNLVNCTNYPFANTTGNVPINRISATGTPGVGNFLRGDGTWAAPSGSGSVNAGTLGQIAYYASAGNAVSGLGTTGTNNVVLDTSPTITTPNLIGQTNGAAIASGRIGERITVNGSAVTLTGASTNLIAYAVPAGCWQITGEFKFVTSSTMFGAIYCGLSLTSATFPVLYYTQFQNIATSNSIGFPVGTIYLNTSATTNVYLVGNAAFTGGAPSAYGTITLTRTS